MSELQLEFLAQWLEQPGNFALLARPTRELVAECSSGNMNRPKKTDYYKLLAQYMNYKVQTKWTEKIACSRYKIFMASYYRVKRQCPLYLPPVAFHIVDLAVDLPLIDYSRHAVALYEYPRVVLT